MKHLRLLLVPLILLLLPGCAAVPFGLGLIPGAPSYVSSIIGNGQTAYETAVDERTCEQQMLDAIIAGHAQAELYKHKDIQPTQVTAYCYFGRLYLVGEYESQKQLRSIYECVDKVENKRGITSCLYLKDDTDESTYFDKQMTITEVEAQLMADFEVTSAPVTVNIVQGDIILLGVISDSAERDKIVAHALESANGGRVISYLYHNEISGPTPRIMTAQLPHRSRKKPSAKIQKKQAIQIRQSTQEVASSTPNKPLVVNGRINGL